MIIFVMIRVMHVLCAWGCEAEYQGVGYVWSRVPGGGGMYEAEYQGVGYVWSRVPGGGVCM